MKSLPLVVSWNDSKKGKEVVEEQVMTKGSYQEACSNEELKAMNNYFGVIYGIEEEFRTLWGRKL